MFFPLVATLVLAAAASATAPLSGNTVQVPHEPTTTSEIFVSKATMAGLFEMEAGKMALTRSRNPAVRDFAQKMVTDHEAGSVELRKLVSTKTYAIPMAMLLDADHQEKLKKLQKTSDKEFDAQYGHSMREGHEEAIAAFTLASAETLVDADLRAYASKTLPLLQSHRELAMKLPMPARK